MMPSIPMFLIFSDETFFPPVGTLFLVKEDGVTFIVKQDGITRLITE